MPDERSGQIAWLPGALSGTPFLAFMAITVAIVWTLAEGYFGPDGRLKLIERQLIEVSAKFNDIDARIDALAAINTDVVVLRINEENTRNSIARLAAQVDAIKEGQGEIFTKLRDIDHLLSEKK